MSASALGWCFDPRLHVILVAAALAEFIALNPASSPSDSNPDDCAFNSAHIVRYEPYAIECPGLVHNRNQD